MLHVMKMKYMEKSVHYGTSLRCSFINVKKGFCHNLPILPFKSDQVERAGRREAGQRNCNVELVC